MKRMTKVLLLLFLSFLVQAGTLVAEGWKKVTPGYQFRFPEDHAAHPEYPVEWWYLTGHLTDENQKHFGVQFTIFRVGLLTDDSFKSRWHASSLYIGHTAITDTESRQFIYCEEVERGALNLAGSDEKRLNTWIHHQRISHLKDGSFAVRFSCKGKELSLTLRTERQPVLHGDNGYSRKGPEEGNASYYSSFTRLTGSGALNNSRVEALAWYDHEVLSADVTGENAGWDWFAIQLENGTELMAYQLRLADETISSYSSAAFIDKEGKKTDFKADQFSISPESFWRSEASNIRYPAAWKIEVPELEMVLNLKPVIANQELDASKSTGKIYWEGAATVRGTAGKTSVSGLAYVELVGYEEIKERK